MKVLDKDQTKEIIQQQIFNAMLRNDGNRAAAAKELNVSIRTFYRYIDTFDLHPIFELCGWQFKPGPPRGDRTAAYGTIRSAIGIHIRNGGGRIDYGRLAREIYGKDTVAIRQRLYSAIDAMKSQGVLVEHDDGTLELQ